VCQSEEQEAAVERYKAGAVVLVMFGLAGLPMFAQSVISMQAGLINFTEGTVLLNDRTLGPRQGQFQQMREQDTLRTSAGGRAEVLLNPGGFLRVDRLSSVRLTSGRITDARIEMLSGSALVEAAEVRKGSSLTFSRGDATVSILRNGLYRLEADPARLHVIKGKALVRAGDRKVEVGGGKVVALDGDLVATRIKKSEGDGLDAWSQNRALRLARANLIATRTSGSLRGLPKTS
jgi:hypothetical protein